MPAESLRGRFAKALVASVVVASLGVGGFLWLAAPRSTDHGGAAAKAYAANGVVKSFGPDRAYANIAHEKIEGYMDAMTMSFALEKPQQAAGIEVGDAVHFTFTADRQGRLVLTSIAKR